MNPTDNCVACGLPRDGHHVRHPFVSRGAAPPPSPPPAIGRIVHFAIYGNGADAIVRPAIITNVFSDTCVNLTIFVDTENDSDRGQIDPLAPGQDTVRRTSVTLGDGEGQWRWPARS